MDDIAYLSAFRLVEKLKKRQIGAVELLEHYLGRVERLNKHINAVVAMDAKGAKKQAEKADSALAKGQDTGPLHGLPVTVKETIAVAGMPMSGGSPERKDDRPAQHAEAVQALIDAGAVVFGKTNVPLFGMDFQAYNEVYGQTNNPWDVALTPGGSSGGAAAAVAAGLSCLDIGSDIGGSIRIPAHFCGVYGHKPSFGIVSMQGHSLFPGSVARSGRMGDDMLVMGPLARSARDIERVMMLIAKPAKIEQTAWRLQLPPPRRTTLREYRIGCWMDDPDFPVDGRVGSSIQAFVDDLSKLAPRLMDRKPEIDFNKSHRLYAKLAAALNGSTLPDGIFERIYRERQRRRGRENEARDRFIEGATQLHRGWMKLNQERILLQQQWASFFEDFDALLMPVAPVTAFPHDHRPFYERKMVVNGREMSYVDTLYSWAGLSGVVYLPSTVIPVGPDAAGLPVGLQIVGPYLEDRTSIHLATLIEEAMGGFVPPPAMAIL